MSRKINKGRKTKKGETCSHDVSLLKKCKYCARMFNGRTKASDKRLKEGLRD